jgi:hypothetical protein
MLNFVSNNLSYSSLACKAEIFAAGMRSSSDRPETFDQLHLVSTSLGTSLQGCYRDAWCCHGLNSNKAMAPVSSLAATSSLAAWQDYDNICPAYRDGLHISSSLRTYKNFSIGPTALW